MFAQAARRDINTTWQHLLNGEPTAGSDALTSSFGGCSYFAILGIGCKGELSFWQIGDTIDHV